jgi:hypothetical protein
LARGVLPRRLRLIARARKLWPQLADLAASMTTVPTSRTTARRHHPAAVPPALRRLSQELGFAIHLASRGDCENAVLPNGNHEEALDCACGRYLNDHTAWTQPPTTDGRDH